MSNVVSIDGGKTHEDRFYFVFNFKDGEIKAFEGDYIGHDVQYPPVMVILSGPEESQFPVAAVNTDEVKYVTYLSKDQVEVQDGMVLFPETIIGDPVMEDGLVAEEGKGPWNEGYV